MAGYFNPESFLTVPQFNSLTSPDPGKYVKQFLDHQAAQEELRQSKQLFPLKEQLAQEEVSKIQALIEGQNLQNQDTAYSLEKLKQYDTDAKNILGVTPEVYELLLSAKYNKSKTPTITSTGNSLVGNTNKSTVDNSSSNVENLVKQATKDNGSLDNSTTTNGSNAEQAVKSPQEILSTNAILPSQLASLGGSDSTFKLLLGGKTLKDVGNSPLYPIVVKSKNGQNGIQFSTEPNDSTPAAVEALQGGFGGGYYKPLFDDYNNAASKVTKLNVLQNLDNAARFNQAEHSTVSNLKTLVDNASKNVTWGKQLKPFIADVFKNQEKDGVAQSTRLNAFLTSLKVNLGDNTALYGNELFPILKKYVKTSNLTEKDLGTLLGTLSTSGRFGNTEQAKEILEDIVLTANEINNYLVKNKVHDNIKTNKNLDLGDLGNVSFYNLSNEDFKKIKNAVQAKKISNALNKNKTSESNNQAPTVQQGLGSGFRFRVGLGF